MNPREGDAMMPLTFANVGEERIIRKVGGKPDVKKHLEDLGFVAGSDVTVVSELAGNIIVRIKESRVAISRALAQKIMI
jgi:ferrous iron transport protein A